MPLVLSRYPVNWRAVAAWLREQVGNCCQECGTPATERTLTCAHVYPANHAPDAEVVQVMVLCITCHLRFDAAHTAAQMRRWHRRHHMALIRMRSPQCSAEDIAELAAAWPTFDYLEGIPT